MPPPPTDGGASNAAGGDPAAAPPPIRPLLPYDDAWTQLRTRDANLDAFIKPDESDDGDLTLSGVRDIAQQRRVACVRAGTAAMPPPTEEAASWLRRYLASLDLLVERAGGVLRSADDDDDGGDHDHDHHHHSSPRHPFETEWTSPLGGRAAKFIPLRGAAKEQAMALVLYGALLRQLGHQALDDGLMMGAGGGGIGGGGAGTSGGGAAAGGAGAAATGRQHQAASDPDASAAAPLAEAAHHLRRAAGVFRRLADRTLPAIFLALGTRDRPLEICPPAADCLAHVCLAEAQALTAFRAEERRSPPSLCCSLHLGARDLYGKASRALRDGLASAAAGGGSSGGASAPPEHARPGDRLSRFLALAHALSSARALKCAAQDLAARFEAGAAERCCDEAARELASAKGAAEADPSWRELVREEGARLERDTAARVRKDRLFVTVQPVPRDLPALPEAKVLVTALPFNEPFVAGGVVDAR
jgi:hypothetical protein